jgi:uncharacterized protein YggE
MRRIWLTLPLLLAACSSGQPDARGLRGDETLLSLSASGEAAAVPDVAVMTIGIEAFGGDAKSASDAAARKSEAIVAALAQFKVEKGDVQTSNLSLGRVGYGSRKGQFQAANTLTVRLHDVPKAGQAVAAATAAGANVLGGPDMQISDPEKANRGAYIAAYKAAETRAQAYAEAAGMEISRVLTIRDGGQGGSDPYAMDAGAAAEVSMNAPRMVAPAPVIMPGTERTRVNVQVDFALRKK